MWILLGSWGPPDRSSIGSSRRTLDGFTRCTDSRARNKICSVFLSTNIHPLTRMVSAFSWPMPDTRLPWSIRPVNNRSMTGDCSTLVDLRLQRRNKRENIECSFETFFISTSKLNFQSHSMSESFYIFLPLFTLCDNTSTFHFIDALKSRLHASASPWPSAVGLAPAFSHMAFLLHPAKISTLAISTLLRLR